MSISNKLIQCFNILKDKNNLKNIYSSNSIRFFTGRTLGKMLPSEEVSSVFCFVLSSGLTLVEELKSVPSKKVFTSSSLTTI